MSETKTPETDHAAKQCSGTAFNYVPLLQKCRELEQRCRYLEAFVWGEGYQPGSDSGVRLFGGKR